MNIPFLDALFAEAVEHPNFFNGRVLAARDLRDLQRATRAVDRRLGQALGPGVVYGLAVSGAGTSLTISGGLAVNAAGDLLALPSEGATVPLVAQPPAMAGSDSPFAPCDLADGIAASNVIDAEFSVLALAPAARLSTEQAPHSGLNGGSASCASRYELEGVQFKLVPLGGLFTKQGPESRYRSRLANACFATDLLLGLASAPFAAPVRYGLIDELYIRGRLTECDVPLAVVRFFQGSIRFVDMWAVRRPCSGLGAAPLQGPGGILPEPFPQHVHHRRILEAQARLLQFQQQLEELRLSLPNPADAVAADHFTHLPAAGYLPLAGPQPGTAGRGFAVLPFFGLDSEPKPLDPAYLRAVFHDSLYVDPLALTPGEPAEVELYRVTGADPQQRYLVFLRRQPVIVEPEPPPLPPPKRGEVVVMRADVHSGPGRGFPVVRTLRYRDEVIIYKEKEGNDGDIWYKIDNDDDAEDEWVHSSSIRLIGEAPPSSQRSTLLVAVVDPAGKPLPASVVARVTATPVGGGKAIEGQLLTGLGSGPARFDLPARTTLTAFLKSFQDELRGLTARGQEGAIFVFERLAPGGYTVAAMPAQRGRLFPNSTVIQLPSGVTHPVTLALRDRRPKGPGGRIDLDDGWTLPNGVLVADVWIDPRWQRLLDDPRRPPVDPDDWWTDPPPDLVEEIQALLSEAMLNETVQGSLALEGMRVLIRPGFNAEQVYDSPYAYAVTADGSHFPLIAVPGEVGLTGDVPATRAALPDLDATTYAGPLADYSLQALPALATAWTGLAATALGLDAAGAAALIQETRAVAHDLQDSFARYPGIDAAANARLKEAFSDDAALANARPEDVLAALNPDEQGNFNLAFAQRLLDRVRAAVPSSAWSLAGLSLSDAELDRLAAVGVTTRRQLANAARNPDLASNLKEALNVDDAGLQRIAGDALAGYLGGKLAVQPKIGVATLPGVTDAMAAKLAGAGLGSAAALAAADTESVAAILEISTQEAHGLMAAAAEHTLTLDAVAVEIGLDAAAVAELRNAGVVSLGDLVKGDAATVGGAVGDAVLGKTLITLAGNILTSRGGLRGRFGG